jgi:hypothetical protein
MKIARSFLAGLLLVGSLGVTSTVMAADQDGTIEKVPLSTGSYCHEEFRAIDGRTLGTNNPAVKSDREAIDYYGPCSESPTGKDQQAEQRLEQQHRFENNYED